MEFTDEVEINEVYCVTYNDSPRLNNIFRGVTTSNLPPMLEYRP